LNDRFYLDLHSHSTDASDDAGGTVEGYLKWIAGRRRRGYRVDGFVLTEHRNFDPSVRYDELAEKYDVVVLKGAELESEIGHVLVYGIDERLSREFDFSRVDIPSIDLFTATRDFGGFAVAAHAGRPRIGLWEYAERGQQTGYIDAIEELNGGSSAEENGRAVALTERNGFYRVGGSDAHYVSAIGRCLTAFSRPIRSVEALVEELRGGDYYPVRIEETQAGDTQVAAGQSEKRA
jgi:predicted metal-dependent phosphoesterase TrpH